MDPLPVIFDISSDDETCCDEPKGDDYDWLSEILKSVDKPPDDSDDVVVVSEVNPRKRAKFSKWVEKDSDDECVILDGDPDKPVGIAKEPETESDELLIVGEKGQVACRDFPHSRQHCAKFPFNSTPHERHCHMCHCYVCDSVAPCIYWSNGSSDVDHCHATEKEERWKLLRSLKQGKSAPPLVKKPANTSDSMQLNQVSQIRRFNHCNMVRSASHSVIQNQVSGPTPIRASTSSTTFTPGQVRVDQSRQIVTKNRTQRHKVSQLNNDMVRKEKDYYIGTQVVPSHNTNQRLVGGVLQMNQPGYGMPHSISHALPVHQPISLLPMVTLSDTSGLLSDTMDSESNIHLETMPSQPQLQNQLISQCINVHQHVNQSQNAIDSSSQNHDKVQCPDESFQVPEFVKESHSLFPLSSDLSLPDFEFESWLLENDSEPSMDAGMLYFDFETSWNGLTHA